MKIGIVGGLGPESTVDYYRMIIEMYRTAKNDGSYPEIIISSVDMKRSLELSEQGDLSGLTEFILVGIQSLAKAGSDVGIIASNTPHIVFDDVQKRSPIPLLSIVEETANYVAAKGIKNVGLLGTRYTMQSDFYQKVLQRYNIASVVPHQDDQDYIQQKLFSEIEFGIFKDETRSSLIDIVQRMKNEFAVQGVILGCTELPLILTNDECGIPFINPSRIHSASVVDYILKKK